MTTEQPDELVGELDLLLSQPPQTANIHILQYPLRHPSFPPGAERQILSAAQRPRAGRLQLTLAVHPTQSDTQTATSFDEQQEGVVMKNIGATQILRSRPHRSAPDANYAIGRYDASRSAFVVVPVASITQLRPAFDYLDDYDMKLLQARMAEKNRADNRAEGGESVSAVQMSFRRRETERAAERRKNSHATLRAMEESEPWQNLSFHSKKEGTSRMESLFNNGINVVKAEESKAFVESTDYEALFRVHTRHVAMGYVAKGALDVDRFSISALRGLPINSAVAQIFAYARVLRFGDIGALLPNGDQREMLKCTRIVAACLRGCWVIKKGLRDGNRARVSTDRYDSCRVLILDLFRRSRIVRMVDACSCLGDPMSISRNSLEGILKEIAEFRSGVGWVFRLEDDEIFQQENAELIRLQDADWEKRIAAARETLTKSVRARKR